MENCKCTNNLLCSHNHLGIGYGKLLNIANTRIGLRVILRVAMNFYENADDMVDELYRLYPEMDSFNTQERTEAASQLLTDFGFASQAYNEAHNHATYLLSFFTRWSLLLPIYPDHYYPDNTPNAGPQTLTST